MSSAFNSDDPSGRRFAEPPEEGDEPRSPSRRELLERVLEETLSRGSGDDPLQPEEIGALVDVTRRHDDRLSREAVVDLVRAVLRLRLMRLTESADLWSTVCEEIATTIWDDPPTCERMQQFWTRLCEAAQ